MKLLGIACLYVIILSGCKRLDVQPVANFNAQKYLGKWYEIARIENSFEKGCQRPTAEYFANKKGGIDIINSCIKNGKLNQAKGTAYFIKDNKTGALKVTFFWPFYGSYNIVELDKNYQYALIFGDTVDYMWILSRTEKIDKDVMQTLLEKAKNKGFDLSRLVIN